ncbi:MAG: hypothetical protein WBL63_07215 [Candidatus Acidiferrum sp.]
MAKTYILQAGRPTPGAGFLTVNHSWRTCRLGGKNNQSTTGNFTRNGVFSQARDMGLWINNAFNFNHLWRVLGLAWVELAFALLAREAHKSSFLQHGEKGLRVESYYSFRRDRRLQHLLDSRENSLKSGVVFARHFLDFSPQFLVGGQQLLKWTNARMMAMLTCTARSLRRTLESIATPCSVKTQGK